MKALQVTISYYKDDNELPDRPLTISHWIDGEALTNWKLTDNDIRDIQLMVHKLGCQVHTEETLAEERS